MRIPGYLLVFKEARTANMVPYPMPGSPKETLNSAIIGRFRVKQGDIQGGREILEEVIRHVERQALPNRRNLATEKALMIAQSVLAGLDATEQRQKVSEVNHTAGHQGNGIGLVAKLRKGQRMVIEALLAVLLLVTASVVVKSTLEAHGLFPFGKRPAEQTGRCTPGEHGQR